VTLPPPLRHGREVMHDVSSSLVTVEALLAQVVDGDVESPTAALAHAEVVAALAMLREGLGRAGTGQRTDVAALLCAITAVQSAATPTAIELVCPPTLVAGVAPVPMRRLVRNLLDNATRAAGPAGRVRLTLRTEEASVRLDVEDDGPGFGRGATGLGSYGLDIVRSVVRGARGRLAVGASMGLGGARITVVLPRAEAT
jgi:signal transduction histidine kinase